MFLQIHFLTSYHASLLNRDDAGLAKRISFGGQERLRISSQCQKRHWREWMLSGASLPHGVRTRHFFGHVVKQQLLDAGMDAALAHSLTFTLANGLLKTKKKKEDALNKDSLDMNQTVLFGEPEAAYFTALIQQAATQGTEDEAKNFLTKSIEQGAKNFGALLREAGVPNPAAGFEGALFGRFITSDVLARVDAPVHVAHAFTTHALDTEVDYFTVVDDLGPAEETGAAHVGDMELGAGLFYGYVAVDIPLLVANLSGAPQTQWREQTTDARHLLDLLIRAIAEVTPGAKLGATAPYARAECVLLEAGTSQPRSLANGFLQPIRLGRADTHPMVQSVNALASYLGAMEDMYGAESGHRFVASPHPWPRKQEVATPLPAAIAACLDALFEGRP